MTIPRSLRSFYWPQDLLGGSELTGIRVPRYIFPLVPRAFTRTTTLAVHFLAFFRLESTSRASSSQYYRGRMWKL